MADSFFDKKDIIGDSFFDNDDIETPKEKEEMSQIEAGLRGAAQGLTFDFGDEIAGAALAGKEALVGDSELGLKELYQKYRDEQRGQMEQAAEEHPVTYYGSDIAAGVVPALLSGGATAAASVGGALAKTAGKGALKQAAKQAAKTGAKMGAATALGASKSDLMEGDVSGAVQDTALGGALGAGLGVATPFLGAGAKKVGAGAKKVGQELADLVPGIEAAKLGYQAGKKGIKATADGVTDAALDWAEKFHAKIVKVMSKSGVEKDQAIKLADEAGVRINAGGLVDEVLEELADKGAIGMELKNKAKFYDNLSALKEGSKELKNLKKLEKKAAMDAAKEKAKYGAEVDMTTEGSDKLDDLLPLPKTEGKVDKLTSKYTADTPEGKVEYAKTFLGADTEHAIKQIELDLEDMSPSDANRALEYINDNLVGDLNKKAANQEQKLARNLAGKINKKLQEGIEDFADPNKTMHNIFKGSRKMGVDKIYGGEEAVENIQDTLAKKIRASGPASDIDKRRAFSSFEKASPELGEVVDEGKFLSKLSEKVGGSDESGSVSAKGLLGAAESVATKATNVAGRAVKAVQTKFAPVTKITKKAANNISSMSQESMNKAAVGMSSSDSKAVQAMGNQLAHAMEQDDTIKNALIWSLSQQPAFRKSVQKFVVGEDQKMSEDLSDNEEVQETESRVPFERPVEETEERVPFERPGIEEVKEEPSREPASVETTEKQPRGIRNNNPGNIDFNENNSWQGQTGKEEGGRFATFSSPEYGIRAMTKLLKNYGSKYNLKTIPQIISKYAPSNENDTDAYAKAIENETGIPTDRAIDFNNKEEVSRLIKAMIKHENGKQPYSDEEINKGVEMALPSVSTVESPIQEEELVAIEKAISREGKQLGTGAGVLGNERSSLDDLMGQLDDLQASPMDKSEMQDAAYSGDIEGLQEMMNKYKQSVS